MKYEDAGVSFSPLDYVFLIYMSASAAHFCDLLVSFDLKLWVTTPTHARGHTLDVIITRNQCRVIEGVGPSDL